MDTDDIIHPKLSVIDWFGSPLSKKASPLNNNLFRSSICGYAQISQVLKLVNIKAIADKLNSDKYFKKFDSSAHLMVMVLSQMAGYDSLRELEFGLDLYGGETQHFGLPYIPGRSTIAYSNEHRNYQFFEAVYYELLPIVQTACRASNSPNPELRLEHIVESDDDLEPSAHPYLKNRLYSIDSTIIDLCHSLYDWALYKRTKGGIKIHTMYENTDCLPVWVLLTNANVHDQKAIETADPVSRLVPGSIIAVDRAYNDYRTLSSWNERGYYYVCRVKDNMRYDVLETHKVPEADGKPKEGEKPRSYVISDETAELANTASKDLHPGRIRIVKVWVEETKPNNRSKSREMRFFTNNFDLPASVIGLCYRRRWEIEAFFKLLKQNLKIKSFLGTSANAVKIQIYSALISILIIRYLQTEIKQKLSFRILVGVFRESLHLHRDIKGWLNAQPERARWRRLKKKPPGRPASLGTRKKG